MQRRETQAFLVRIPRPLHTKVKREAKRQSISMAEFVRKALRDQV